MRTILVLGGLCFLAACGGNPNVPPQVTWSYGSGNGDPVANGSAVKYSYANGLGQDMPVGSGQLPRISRAYGADETKGVMEQMSPAQQAQQLATAPAAHPAIAPAPSSHL